MKRKISEILKDMDEQEKVVISDELIDTLKDHFKEEIESEKNEDKNEDEKVAKSDVGSLIRKDKGNSDYGQSDRI